MIIDSSIVSGLETILKESYLKLLETIEEEVKKMTFNSDTKFIEIPFNIDLRGEKNVLYISDLKEYPSLEELTNFNINDVDPCDYDFRNRIILEVINGKPNIDKITLEEPRIKKHEGDQVGYHYRDKDNQYKWFRSRVIQRKYINPDAFKEKVHLFEENYVQYVRYFIDDAVKDFYNNKDIQAFETQINNLFEQYLHEDIFTVNDSFLSEKDQLANTLYLIYHIAGEYGKSWTYLKKLAEYRNERNHLYQNDFVNNNKEKFLISVSDMANVYLKCTSTRFEASDIFYIIGSHWKATAIENRNAHKLLKKIQHFLDSFYKTNGTEFIKSIYEKYSSVKPEVDEIKIIAKQNKLGNLKGRSDFWLKSYKKNLTNFESVTVFVQKAVEWELIQLVKNCELSIVDERGVFD